MEKFNDLRRKVFNVIEPLRRTNKVGQYYDLGMLVVIFLSILPLAFPEEVGILLFIDKACMVIFIIDYILRWVTADFKLKDKSFKSFLKYPFTPMAIIDLVSILPSLTIINHAFKLLRLVRALRIVRLIRVIKLARYSENLKLIRTILKKCARPMLTVGGFAVAYVAIAGLIAYNVEGDMFNSYFDAMYWVVVVWNEDPQTVTGHILAICSILFGISIVALPASIITAEYTNHLSHIRRKADLKKEIAELEEDVEKTIEKDISKEIKKEIKKDMV